MTIIAACKAISNAIYCKNHCNTLLTCFEHYWDIFGCQNHDMEYNFSSIMTKCRPEMNIIRIGGWKWYGLRRVDIHFTFPTNTNITWYTKATSTLKCTNSLNTALTSNNPSKLSEKNCSLDILIFAKHHENRYIFVTNLYSLKICIYL